MLLGERGIISLYSEGIHNSINAGLWKKAKEYMMPAKLKALQNNQTAGKKDFYIGAGVRYQRIFC